MTDQPLLDSALTPDHVFGAVAKVCKPSIELPLPSDFDEPSDEDLEREYERQERERIRAEYEDEAAHGKEPWDRAWASQQLDRW